VRFWIREDVVEAGGEADEDEGVARGGDGWE
jgi:hypothetical protein